MERGLQESERDELLKEPRTAVLATERKAGGVHAAPVWYLYRRKAASKDGRRRARTNFVWPSP